MRLAFPEKAKTCLFVEVSCLALALSSGLLKARVSDLGRPHREVFESEAGGD